MIANMHVHYLVIVFILLLVDLTAVVGRNSDGSVALQNTLSGVNISDFLISCRGTNGLCV